MGIIAVDITNYEPYNIPRHFHGIYENETFYVVYQDYRNLHSSVGLITWDGKTKDTESEIIVKGGWDNVNPKLFRFSSGSRSGLLISWVEYYGEEQDFVFAEYNTATGKLGEKYSNDISLDIRHFDYSFNGTHYLLVSRVKDAVKIYHIDSRFDTVSEESIPIIGTVWNIHVDENDIYYALTHDDQTRIYWYHNNTNQFVTELEYDLIHLTGHGNYLAWLEEVGLEEQWSRLTFYNADTNLSCIQPIELSSYMVELFVDAETGYVYVSWCEDLTDPTGDDSNAEVRLAVVPNATEPQFTVLKGVSKVDGEFSGNQFFIETDNGVWIFWMDMVEEYSLWAGQVQEAGVYSKKMLIKNGEISFELYFIFIMVLTMGTMMGFMFSLKGMVRKDKTKKEEPEKKAAKTKRGFDVELLVYNKKEPYFFLKFYFAVIPFLYLIGIFYNLMGEPGMDLGFRIGFGSIINNCIAIIATSITLFMLRTESNASMEHRVGYGMIQTAFGAAVLGLFWYEVMKNTVSPYTVYVITGTSLLATMLSLIGPMVMISALTKKKQFYIPIFALFVVIVMQFYDFMLYRTYSFFPSINAPLRLLTSNTSFLNMLIIMFTGIMMGMILFDIFKFEKFKSLNLWTKKDIDAIRNRALFVSILIVSVLTSFSISFSVGTKALFDLGATMENALFVFMLVAMTFVIGMMIKAMYTRDQFKKSFIESPSSAIYGLFLIPSMIPLMMMLFVLFMGYSAFILLVLYGYTIYKGNQLLEELYKGALEEAVIEEEKDEELKLKQITRSDVGMLIKRNLKYMLAIPPFGAMVFLLLWKAALDLPQFRLFGGGTNIWVDAVVMALGFTFFIELWYAKRKFTQAEKLEELIGLSSTSGGFIIFILLPLFYTLAGGSVYVIIYLVILYQIEVILYIKVIYPALLAQLNSEQKEFFKVSEANELYIKNLKDTDKKLYSIPLDDDEPIAEVGSPIPGTNINTNTDDFTMLGPKAEVGFNSNRGGLGIVGQDSTAYGDQITDIDRATAKTTNPEQPRGRGRYLTTEPENALVFRQEDMRRKAASIMAMGAAAVVILWVFGIIVLPIGTCFITLIILSFLGLLLIPMGWYLRKTADKFQPIKFYEHGMEVVEYGGELVFYPYAAFTNAVVNDYRGEKVLVLRSANKAFGIMVWPGFEDQAKVIPNMVGTNPESMPKGYGEQVKRFETIRKFTIPISVGTGLLIAAIMAFTSYQTLNPIPAALISFSLVTVFMYTYLMFRQKKWERSATAPYIFSRRNALVLLIGCILISAGTAVVFSGTMIIYEGVDRYTEDVSEIGNKFVRDSDLTDEVIYYQKWLIISGEVKIQNCTITFNCTYSGQYGVIIQEGSVVEISNSIIKAPSQNRGFMFESFGHVSILNSEIYNVYGNIDQINYDGGLEFYSDSELDNTLIQGSETNGILIIDCKVRISNCEIRNTGDEGIEVVGEKSRLELDNSVLENCSWGIHLINFADGRITDSRLRNCSHALTLSPGAKAKVEDTIISGSDTVAIYTYPDTKMETKNLELSNNEQDYGRENYLITSVCCLVLPLIITVILALFTIRFANKNKVFDGLTEKSLDYKKMRFS